MKAATTTTCLLLFGTMALIPTTNASYETDDEEQASALAYWAPGLHSWILFSGDDDIQCPQSHGDDMPPPTWTGTTGCSIGQTRTDLYGNTHNMRDFDYDVHGVLRDTFTVRWSLYPVEAEALSPVGLVDIQYIFVEGHWTGSQSSSGTLTEEGIAGPTLELLSHAARDPTCMAGGINPRGGYGWVVEPGLRTFFYAEEVGFEAKFC